MTDEKLKEIQARVASGATFTSDTRALLAEVIRLRKPAPKPASKTVTPPSKPKAKAKAKKNGKPKAPPADN